MSDNLLRNTHEILRDDGARLASYNSKSRTIHIVSLTPAGGYGNAVCRNQFCGGEKLYLDTDELDAEYVIRDGEVRGKLCGNCVRGLQHEDDDE